MGSGSFASSAGVRRSITVRTPCARSAPRPPSLRRQSWSERTSAPSRTRWPSTVVSPPRSRALRQASHARARDAPPALTPNDASDVRDAHDDEKEQQQDESDRVHGGLRLWREAHAEDAAQKHEEEPAAVETRERDDVEHGEVHRQHADELEEVREPVLRDLSGDAEDLDRPPDLRTAGRAARREELTRELGDLH